MAIGHVFSRFLNFKKDFANLKVRSGLPPGHGPPGGYPMQGMPAMPPGYPGMGYPGA